jgi:hypothetical protein
MNINDNLDMLSDELVDRINNLHIEGHIDDHAVASLLGIQEWIDRIIQSNK